MFMKIYAFSLCITLAIGVAAYTTVFPTFIVQKPDIQQIYDKLMNEISLFLNGDITSFADGFFATAYIAWASLRIALFLLVSAPAIVQQTVNYFGMPEPLAYPILFLNTIAFVGTVYNVIRGLKSLKW